MKISRNKLRVSFIENVLDLKGLTQNEFRYEIHSFLVKEIRSVPLQLPSKIQIFLITFTKM